MKTEHVDENQIAHAIREACIQAAMDGYEDAAINGLCHDGAWEAAIDAMRMLDTEEILHAIGCSQPDQGIGGDRI